MALPSLMTESIIESQRNVAAVWTVMRLINLESEQTIVSYSTTNLWTVLNKNIWMSDEVICNFDLYVLDQYWSSAHHQGSITLIFDVQILDHPLYNIRTWNKRNPINMNHWNIANIFTMCWNTFLHIDANERENNDTLNPTHLPSSSQCIPIPLALQHVGG